MHNQLRFLGLLNRGGKLTFGPGVEDHIDRYDLLIVASDSSRAQKAKEKAIRLNIPVVSCFSKEEIGEPLGYDELSLVGIRGKKEAKAFLAKGDKHEEEQ